jgi:hypothetical protein
VTGDLSADYSGIDTIGSTLQSLANQVGQLPGTLRSGQGMDITDQNALYELNAFINNVNGVISQFQLALEQNATIGDLVSGHFRTTDESLM